MARDDRRSTCPLFHQTRFASREDSILQLSRWLWLVKWLLAIPHFIVLLFLFIAFVLLTIVAFFAILFTGRYPRSIFDFNLGVLRWAWRVGFYTYDALGTDRYPPFTLGPEPDYPATLDVAVPGRAVAGARAREVVAPRDPALPRPQRLPRRRLVRLERGLGRGRPFVERRPGPDRPPGALCGDRAPLHDALPAGDLRLRRGAEPAGYSVSSPTPRS